MSAANEQQCVRSEPRLWTLPHLLLDAASSWSVVFKGSVADARRDLSGEEGLDLQTAALSVSASSSLSRSCRLLLRDSDAERARDGPSAGSRCV